VSQTAPFLSPSETAARLGVSAKALRLYEQRGLVTPLRSAAGWRTYGPEQMARAADVAALRALGLSLAQVERVLDGKPADLDAALVSHEATLGTRIRALSDAAGRVRELRAELALGRMPQAGQLAKLVSGAGRPGIAFELPWPWGGESFALKTLAAITFIVGPLGSGKTRLALRLAETLPGAAFLDLDRAKDPESLRNRLAANPALAATIDEHLHWLAEEGATPSDALLALLVGLEAEGHGAIVVDMVEQGLDATTQAALIAHLRRRGPGARPLLLMTRSSAILDPADLGPDEAILFCPANHSPPFLVEPHPGARGYEAMATCLASPEVRARTEGVIAWRPSARA